MQKNQNINTHNVRQVHYEFIETYYFPKRSVVLFTSKMRTQSPFLSN